MIRQNIKITFETFKLIYCIVFRMIVAYVILNIILVQGMKIDKIRNQSELYFERKGEMKISNSNWKIMVFVNLTETMIRNKELYSHVSRFCRSIKNNEMCNHFTEIATKELQELDKLENLIHESVGKRERAKRCLINVIGQVQKLLFGTMDSEDANLINEKLHTLSNDESEIRRLMSKQLTVLKSTISDLNLHETDSLEFEKVYAHTINDLVNTVNNQTDSLNIVNARIKFNSFKNTFQMLVGQQKSV